jgi:hypothetical protein
VVKLATIVLKELISTVSRLVNTSSMVSAVTVPVAKASFNLSTPSFPL